MKRRAMRLYKKAKASQSQYFWNKYNTVIEYHAEIKNSKEKFKKAINEALKASDHRNSKPWWKTAKEVLGFVKDSSIPCLKDKDEVITDSLGKAELLNKSFASFSNIDTNSASRPNIAKFPLPFASLDEVVVCESEVLDVLEALNTSKSSGPDGISPRLLNMCAAELSPSLTKLFIC